MFNFSIFFSFSFLPRCVGVGTRSVDNWLPVASSMSGMCWGRWWWWRGDRRRGAGGVAWRIARRIVGRAWWFAGRVCRCSFRLYLFGSIRFQSAAIEFELHVDVLASTTRANKWHFPNDENQKTLLFNGSVPVLKQPVSTKASVYTSCRIILNVKISNVDKWRHNALLPATHHAGNQSTFRYGIALPISNRTWLILKNVYTSKQVVPIPKYHSLQQTAF